MPAKKPPAKSSGSKPRKHEFLSPSWIDAVVTVDVSKGPAPRAVPATAGLSATAASAALETAGFKVKGITGSATRTVLTTDPPAGEVQPFGTLVQIIMRSS